MEDEMYMQLALDLAQKGMGKVNPNPLVGAVVVKNGEVIGTGYHQRYGESHAEPNAIANCTESPKGATLYVTLEPCCHYGRTPPCTQAILDCGIQRVVVGMLDPNEKVAGKGVELLQKAGIVVDVGILEQECMALNTIFLHYITTKTPYVTMKYAMTLDGKIATIANESKWITGDLARKFVHRERNRHPAIMVGIGTVLADNPMLTCRIEGGRNPIRIICDTNLRIPVDSNIVQTAKEIPTILATLEEDEAIVAPLQQAGCEILVVSEKEGKVDLQDLMCKLGEKNIDGILLEGGSELHFSALQSQIVQKIQCYIAPKLFGGVGAKTPVGGVGFPHIADAIQLKNQTFTQIGEDILLEGEVVYPCLQEL